MKKEMLINVAQPEECRIAIVEDGSLEELYIERASQDNYVGNIYKGKVVNLEPSIQAAFVDFGVGASDLGNPASFALGYLNDDSLLFAELSAIQADGRAEVVSQPKLITGDKQEAEIKTGEEIPFLESSSSGRTTVKFREAVLSLKVTPSITPDNRVILDLTVKQDARSRDVVFGELDSQIPIIDKNEINTQVLIDNGETLVLGGVFRESETLQESKVPVLGDIPIVGRLFKRTLESSEKRELLIFITPRILADRVLD